jgi:hypothetical protein
MKSFIKSLKFLAIVLILASCSQESDTSKLKEEPNLTAEEEKLFTDLITSHHEAWSANLIDLIPDLNLSDYLRESLELTADIKAEEEGEVIEIDYQQTQDRHYSEGEGETQGTFSGNFKLTTNPDSSIGSMFPNITIDFEGQTRFFATEFFTIFDSLNLTTPDISTEESSEALSQFTGKWYGDSYDNFNNTIRKDNFILALSFDAPNQGLSLPKLPELKKTLETELQTIRLWQPIKVLQTEAEFDNFQVRLDQEETQGSIKNIFSALVEDLGGSINAPENQEQFKASLRDLEARLLTQLEEAKVNGTLSIHKENPEYFRFIGELEYQSDRYSLDFNWLEAEKSAELVHRTTGDKINISFTGSSFAEFNLEISSKNTPIVSLVKTTQEINFSAQDTGGSNSFQLNLTKSAEGFYTGTLASPVNQLTVDFTKLELSLDSITAQGTLAVSGIESNFDLAWGYQPIEEFTTEKPSGYETFEVLLPKLYIALNELLLTVE